MNENPYRAPQAARQLAERHEAPPIPVSPRVRADEKTIGKPCAGNPHVRFERGPQETWPARYRA
jgi:hypothetical protein